MGLKVVDGFKTKSSVASVNVLRFNASYVLREAAESKEETYAIFHPRKTEEFY